VKKAFASAAVAGAGLAAAAVIRRMDRRRGKGGELPSEGGSEDHWVESADGTRIHLEVRGDSDPTIFFVHGWMCDSTIFRHQLEHFAGDYRVVAVDLRGHGRSDIPENKDYRCERYAEDLNAAVELIQPESFVIAGHSMGGFTAFKFYERFAGDCADRLKGLMIIDSTGTRLVEGLVLGRAVDYIYPSPLERVMTSLDRRSVIAQKVKEAVRNTSAVYALVRWAAFGRKPAGSDVEFVREMLLDTHVTSSALAALSCCGFSCDCLSEIDLPVLLLVGDRDKLTNLEVNMKTARMLPDARMVVFPGAGHCTLLERRDEFNREVSTFLDEVIARG
jgi:pimeloyl-ACP methyl ester carboxylesterase